MTETLKAENAISSNHMLDMIERCLDETKAQDIVVIDLSGKSAFAEYMIVATGQSQRQLGAIADRISNALTRKVLVEGVPDCDWVLVDAGDVVVHLFKPESRTFYNLEKMWGAEIPQSVESQLALV